MDKTARRQFQQHANRQWVKQRAQHEGITMKGAQTFIKNKKKYEEIYSDKFHVVDGKISASRLKIMLALLNMTSNLIGKGQLVSCSDDTRKLDLNGFQMMAMGMVDKQNKFNPAIFVLKSYGDEESCQ